MPIYKRVLVLQQVMSQTENSDWARQSVMNEPNLLQIMSEKSLQKSWKKASEYFDIPFEKHSFLFDVQFQVFLEIFVQLFHKENTYYWITYIPPPGDIEYNRFFGPLDSIPNPQSFQTFVSMGLENVDPAQMENKRKSKMKTLHIYVQDTFFKLFSADKYAMYCPFLFINGKYNQRWFEIMIEIFFEKHGLLKTQQITKTEQICKFGFSEEVMNNIVDICTDLEKSVNMVHNLFKSHKAGNESSRTMDAFRLQEKKETCRKEIKKLFDEYGLPEPPIKPSFSNYYYTLDFIGKFLLLFMHDEDSGVSWVEDSVPVTQDDEALFEDAQKFDLTQKQFIPDFYDKESPSLIYLELHILNYFFIKFKHDTDLISNAPFVFDKYNRLKDWMMQWILQTFLHHGFMCQDQIDTQTKTEWRLKIGLSSSKVEYLWDLQLRLKRIIGEAENESQFAKYDIPRRKTRTVSRRITIE